MCPPNPRTQGLVTGDLETKQSKPLSHRVSSIPGTDHHGESKACTGDSCPQDFRRGIRDIFMATFQRLEVLASCLLSFGLESHLCPTAVLPANTIAYRLSNVQAVITGKHWTQTSSLVLMTTFTFSILNVESEVRKLLKATRVGRLDPLPFLSVISLRVRFLLPQAARPS